MFPGTLRGGPIDGHEVDLLPPHIRVIHGFLMVQRLMPQSQFNMGQNVWRRMAAQLFGIIGRYRLMISWAGSAPVPGGTAAWFGVSDGSAYMLGRLAAYFTANGVLYEDADNEMNCERQRPNSGSPLLSMLSYRWSWSLTVP